MKISRKLCSGCFNYFSPDNKSIAYCSRECIKLVEWEKREARLLDVGAEDVTLEKHRRKHPKYRVKRILLGADKIDIEEYKKCMKELREERIRSGEIEEIDLDALIERDGGICHICSKKVAKRVKFGSSRGKGMDRTMYPTVDHVVPISRGGTHVWSNVKLAHLSCNAKKGAKHNIP